tara:strand:- start:208 stop:507 length:300 start_codon:yes stop_codon:yes gene_type:complete
MKGKYTFVSKKDDDLASICITDNGKYHGVVYKYGVVSVAEEENEDGTLPFRFEYDIVDNYGVSKDEFGEEFFTLIGDILVHIIDTQDEEIDDEEEEEPV